MFLSLSVVHYNVLLCGIPLYACHNKDQEGLLSYTPLLHLAFSPGLPPLLISLKSAAVFVNSTFVNSSQQPHMNVPSDPCWALK